LPNGGEGWGEGATHYFGTDGHGSVRVLYDLAAAIAKDLANAARLQIYTFDAYGNLLSIGGQRLPTSNFPLQTSFLPLTTYLYSGESFDFNIGQQYLRARFYDATTGRFNRLDPFAGNSSDPQSFHKYAYVHGDPIQGIDPTGMFWQTLFLQAKSAAANLAGLAYARATLFTIQAVSRIRIWYYTGLMMGTAVSYNFPTFLNKIDNGVQAFEVGMLFVDGAANLLENLSSAEMDELNSTHGPGPRGKLVEKHTGANVTGNFPEIDDLQADDDGRTFITSIKSHGESQTNTPEKLLRNIVKDVDRLHANSSRTLAGTTKSGIPIVIDPNENAYRAVLVAIPESSGKHISAITSQLRSLARTTNTIIQIVPIRRWRGR
jgi:RHS repeat-associated protein